MLLVTESAPDDKRGFYGAFAQAGAPVGVILANLAFITISAMVSDEFFNTWGMEDTFYCKCCSHWNKYVYPIKFGRHKSI